MTLQPELIGTCNADADIISKVKAVLHNSIADSSRVL
jgi:hypothetical protein